MVKSGSGIVAVKPELIQTSQLVDPLRRRLAAYALGKHISTNVFATREAPPVIEMDRVVLDRVADNLLTNAVKYTEKGNVLVEIDGKPGFLTIKVSDTGRGIEEEEKARIFLPEGSDALRRAERSHGVGLSGVARLMNLVGGKIEVMSLAGKGTTFWVHFPVRMRRPDEKSTRPSVAPEAVDIVGKVVTFRKSIAP
jgi:signal transduction histidine kinase